MIQLTTNLNNWRADLPYILGDLVRTFTLKRVALAAGVAVLVWLVWRDWNTVVVESIGVPKEYEDAGFTKSVVTQRVVNAIKSEEQAVPIESKSGLVLSTDEDILTDFEVPGTRFNAKEILTFVRNSLGFRQKHISGEIAIAKKNQSTQTNQPSNEHKATEIMFRISGSDGEEETTLEGPVRDPDDAIKQLSEGILEKLKPFAFASYVGINENDSARAIPVVQTLIRNEEAGNSKLLASYYNLLGRIYFTANHNELAISNFSIAAKLEPRSAIPVTNIGIAELDSQNYNAAIEQFQKAIKVQPHFAIAYSYLGVALYENDPKNADEAIEQFKLAERWDKKYAPMYLNWGSVLLESHPADAIEKFKKAEKFSLTHPLLPYLWGKALEATGQLDEALDKYQEAHELELPNPDLYEDWDQALLKRSKFGKYGIKDPEVYVRWGDILSQITECQTAIEKYESADRLDPNNFRTLTQMGLAQLSCKKWKEAQRSFEKTISLDPTSSPAHYNLGLALFDQREYKQAKAEFQKALHLEPKNPDAQVYVGRIYMAEGQCANAIEEFQKAIANQPGNAFAFNYFGVTLNNEGKPQEAIARIQKAIELDPHRVEFPYTLSMVMQEGEPKKPDNIDPETVQLWNEHFKFACAKPRGAKPVATAAK